MINGEWMDSDSLSLKSFVETNARLYSLPEVYFQLKKIIDDPEKSLIEAAEVIACDPALTMRVLRLVNSAFFGFGQKIETVRHAVNLLGMQQLHDLVLATSVRQAFPNLSENLISVKAFWSKSLHCGVLARLLATQCNVIDSERLFVAGLLADIGHLLMYEKLPRPMEQILTQTGLTWQGRIQMERNLIGFDFSAVGAALMRNWELPEGLSNIVEYHTRPSQAPKEQLEATIVHLAHWAVDYVKLNESKEVESPQMALQLVGLPAEQFDKVRMHAEEQFLKVNALF